MEDIKSELLPTTQEMDDMADVASFPQTIAKQIGILLDLDGKVKSAKKKALAATAGAESLDGYVRKKLLGVEYKSGDTKKKIEAIQDVVKKMAIAQEENANATELSFEFQEAISKTTENLFVMGCIDMAANEAMIEQIKEIRDGNFIGGKINLTEDVKKRILEVAQRLKAHQDILLKMEKLKTDLSNLEVQQSMNFDKVKGDIEKSKKETSADIIGIESKYVEMSSSVSNLMNSIAGLKQSANKSSEEVNRAIADLRDINTKSRSELDQIIADLSLRQTETSSSVADFKKSTDKNISDVKEAAAKIKTELDQAMSDLVARQTETSSSIAELKSAMDANITDVKSGAAKVKSELEQTIEKLSSRHTEMSSAIAEFKSATEQGILALNNATERTRAEVEQRMISTDASYQKEIENLKKKNNGLTLTSILTFILVLLLAFFNVIQMLA